jgi:Transcriptional regulator
MEQSLSQYRIFYEVARLGNISKAAKELYISQPAISKAISKLEGNINSKLFTRNSRGVQLTYEGKVLYEHIRNAFDSIQRGETEIKRIQNYDIGSIRFGVSTTMGKFLLLPILQKFILKYPHVKINIENNSSHITIPMLEKQQLDLGLIVEPTYKYNFKFEPIMDIEDIFVASPTYLRNLYLREGDNVNIFKSGNIMMLDSNNVTRLYIDHYLREQNIEVNQILEVSSMDLLIEFARIGLGIACVIKEFVQDELDNETFIKIPLSEKIYKRTVGFAYSSSTPPVAVKQFLDLASETEN